MKLNIKQISFLFDIMISRDSLNYIIVFKKFWQGNFKIITNSQENEVSYIIFYVLYFDRPRNDKWCECKWNQWKSVKG